MWSFSRNWLRRQTSIINDYSSAIKGMYRELHDSSHIYASFKEKYNKEAKVMEKVPQTESICSQEVSARHLSILL